jgi:hypothetical protein
MTQQRPFLSEPQWHQEQSPRLCPLWLQEPSCLPFSFSWRSCTMSRPLQPGVGLLRRLCHPSHTLALSRPQTRPGGIGLPKFHGVRRIAVPLGACCRPGASGTTYRHTRTLGTSHHPFWVRCISHFHLFGFTIFHTQISLVTIGTRCHLTHKSAIWVKICVRRAKWRRYGSNSNHRFLLRPSASSVPSLYSLSPLSCAPVCT